MLAVSKGALPFVAAMLLLMCVGCRTADPTKGTHVVADGDEPADKVLTRVLSSQFHHFREERNRLLAVIRERRQLTAECKWFIDFVLKSRDNTVRTQCRPLLFEAKRYVPNVMPYVEEKLNVLIEKEDVPILKKALQDALERARATPYEPPQR